MNRNKIVYQIYPKSFKDTNGDGIGDIPGIIEKLDYLQYLGINVIWLTPIFISPQNDNGYDIVDYYNIDPLFGTMEDVETLIYEAQLRGIDIMFDMVLNHTSTHHTWFKKALNGDKKYKDFYIFKDKPTNWESKFGGNAWEYVKDLDAYYLHLFDVTQADLNWNNPDVFNELCNVVNFWLEKGVKGLRFDVINLISKPDVFEDDENGDGRRYYTDGPRVHEFIHNLNRETFGKYEDILTVGELSSTDIENGVRYTNPKNEELHSIFNFHHLKVDYKDKQKWLLKDYDFIEFKKIIEQWQLNMQDNDANMALFLNNHDQPRAISRFGNDQKYHYESATLWAGLMMYMKGIPYLYQGEEIGLPNAYFDSIEDYRDIESINYYNLNTQLDEATRLEVLRHRSRDNGRTPMPWDNTDNYGFTTGMPWLGFSKHDSLPNVQDQLESETSIFNFYRKIIAYRKISTILQQGSITFKNQNSDELFHYERNLNDETIIIIGNVREKEINYDINGKEILLSNYNRKEIPNILQPYELVIIKK